VKPRAALRVFQDPRFLRHDPGPGHPESVLRLAAVHAALDAAPVPGTESCAAPAAGRAALERVHTPAYLERIAATEGGARTVLDADTIASAESHCVALHAVGAALAGVEAVIDGSAHHAFALTRPPGHHARRDSSMGFCLYNTVAIAAAHALEAGGLDRVLVLDPDVHHGNGTQEAFYDSDRVLFVSSQQYPFWPGSGAVEELGTGRGAGFSVNLPLPAGSGDADYLQAWSQAAGPLIEEFDPQLILVSAGFDAWHSDPLGGMALTESGYAALYRLFRSWSDRHCPGRMVACLEGGYDPDGLATAVRTALAVLAAETSSPPEPREETPAASRLVARSQAALAPFWKTLS